MRIPNAILLAATLALALTLTACSKPEPDPAEPLDPQASAAAPAEATELRDAINEPLAKAHAVEATQAAEEAERQQSLEETGG
jgi:hypothetical protein